MIDVFYIVLVWVGFCGLVTIGALVAKLCGYQLNEPEYYIYLNERKKTNV